jgi:hypothetical protein
LTIEQSNVEQAGGPKPEKQVQVFGAVQTPFPEQLLKLEQLN